MQNEPVKTMGVENLDEDKTTSIKTTSFNLYVSDKPYIMSTPPIKSPSETPQLPPIVVGYNPRKVGRYNFRPNLKPDATLDFP